MINNGWYNCWYWLIVAFHESIAFLKNITRPCKVQSHASGQGCQLCFLYGCGTQQLKHNIRIQKSHLHRFCFDKKYAIPKVKVVTSSSNDVWHTGFSWIDNDQRLISGCIWFQWDLAAGGVGALHTVLVLLPWCQVALRLDHSCHCRSLGRSWAFEIQHV